MTATAKCPKSPRSSYPGLFCRDVAAEIDFCVSTFGAVEGVRRPVRTIATRIEETTEEERQARLAQITAESKK